MSPCPKRITASTPSGVIVTLIGKKPEEEHATCGELRGRDLVTTRPEHGE